MRILFDCDKWLRITYSLFATRLLSLHRQRERDGIYGAVSEQFNYGIIATASIDLRLKTGMYIINTLNQNRLHRYICEYAVCASKCIDVMQYPMLWMLGLRLNLYIRELTIAHFAERASFHLRMGLDGIGFLMHDVVTFRAKMCADCMFLMSLNAHAAVGLHKTPFQLQSNQNEPLFIWFEWRIRSWKFTSW